MLRDIWRQTTWRHWRGRWRETGTLVLILALGLSVFLAVRLANRASVASFGTFVGAVSGQTDWIVTSPSGVVPNAWLPEVRKSLGSEPAYLVPVKETPAARLGEDGSESLVDLVGLDLVAILNLRYARPDEPATEGLAPGTFLDDDLPLGLPSVALAQELGEVETIEIVLADQPVTVRIGETLPPNEDGLGVDRAFLLMDLPTLLDLTGEEAVDRVEIVVPDGPQLEERREKVAALLRVGSNERWTVDTPATERSTGETMTEAFRLNLTILSLIALIVGLYLVFQALEAAVVRRRREIATLRALGLTRGDIRRLWLVDAMALGTLGTLGGLVLGWLGGQAAVGLVGQTVQTIYGGSGAAAPALTGLDVLATLALGLIASAIAGFLPAEEAARTPPAQVLSRGQVSQGLAILRHPWRGVPVILLGMFLATLPAIELPSGTPFPVAAYGAAFAWMIGGTLVAVLAVPGIGWALRWLGPGQAALRVASGRLRRASGRHKLTVAGLLIAAGMAGAILIMVESFQRTMLVWIGETLQGDLYVAPRGATSANDFRMIPVAVWSELAADPAVAQAWPVQGRRVMFAGDPIILVGSSLQNPSRNYIWLEEPPADVNLVSGVTDIEPAFVSESFVSRQKIGMGEAVTLDTPAGPQTVIVQGVYAEYGNEFGTILVEREAVARWFGRDGASRMTVELREGFSAAAVRERWRESYPGLDVRTNTGLRTEVLRLFRQTFSVTYALQVIGLTVALAGLGLGLVALAQETRAETTTLRALGFSRGQLALATVGEGTGLAAAGMAGGLALAAALGWLLVYVVNKQAFGWTLSLAIPWASLGILTGLVLVVGAAIAGAVGWRAAENQLEREE